MITAIGGIFAFAMVFVSFSISNNFWISIVCFSASSLGGDVWLSPSITMIQSMFSPDMLGTAVSIFGLAGGI